MNNTLRMTVSDSFQALGDNVFDRLLSNNSFLFDSSDFLIFSYKIKKSSFDVLKYQIKFTCNSDYFFKFYNVWVHKFAKMFNFSKRHTFIPGAEFLFHFFYGYDFASLFVQCLNYSAVGSITNIFYNLKFIHN